MTLTKTIIDDKIEVVGDHKHIQIRTATIIKEDGKELSRSFTRRVLHAGTLDGSDNFVDTDISSESAEIQGIANTVWTTDVKNSYKAFLITNKP
tara:strand:+ start:659 stop:940 length:282 start_codon:yes stop_codon:yes gene_type:complete